MSGSFLVGQTRRLTWWLGLLTLLLLSAAARAQTGRAAADSLSSVPAGSLTTAGGVRYLVHQAGSGPRVQPNNRVTVRYRAYLPSGQLFDSSDSAGRPLRFRVGRGEVIPGWDELLPLLAAGTRVRAWVPARLAYGSRGVPDADSGY